MRCSKPCALDTRSSKCDSARCLWTSGSCYLCALVHTRLSVFTASAPQRPERLNFDWAIYLLAHASRPSGSYLYRSGIGTSRLWQSYSCQSLDQTHSWDPSEAACRQTRPCTADWKLARSKSLWKPSHGPFGTSFSLQSTIWPSNWSLLWSQVGFAWRESDSWSSPHLEWSYVHVRSRTGSWC